MGPSLISPKFIIIIITITIIIIIMGQMCGPCIAVTTLNASHIRLYSILTEPFGVQSIINPILQMRILRHRERRSNTPKVPELVCGG